MKKKFSNVSCLLNMNALYVSESCSVFCFQLLNLNANGHFQRLLQVGQTFCRPLIWCGSQSSTCGQYYMPRRNLRTLVLVHCRIARQGIERVGASLILNLRLKVWENSNITKNIPVYIIFASYMQQMLWCAKQVVGQT